MYNISVQRNLVLAHFDAAIFHRQCGIPREGGHASPDAGARKNFQCDECIRFPGNRLESFNVMKVSKFPANGLKSFNMKSEKVSV